MICDLNIIYPVTEFEEKLSEFQLNQIKSTLTTAEQLGYTHIALNFKPSSNINNNNNNSKIKIPNDLNKLNPINIDRDFKDFKDKIKIFTRITVKIDDPSQCQNIAKFQQVFDIISVEPKTERSFQLAISNLDIDLISFNLQDRLPCYMKHKTLCSAVEKGIKFELKYTDFLSNKNRSQAISNAKQIIRACRNRGLICSSGCEFDKPSNLRNFNNVVPLLEMIGIDSNRANQCFKDWSLKVLLNGRLRIKSYKQVIVISGDDGLIDNTLENKDWESVENKKSNIKFNVESYKKRKVDNALDRELKKQKV